jgi:peroxin-13
MLYGELARFVLRLLGVKRKPKKGSLQGPQQAQAFEGPSQQFIEAPKANNWDNVWGN